LKLIILTTSLRRNGNTERLARLYEQEIRSQASQKNIPFEVELIPLYQYRIEPCRGCRTCFDRGVEHCPIKDDFPLLLDKMKAADGIILACPVYVNDVNGLAKNWIDRMAYACHRPDFFGKYAGLLATIGIGPTNHALNTMSFALNSWGYQLVHKTGYKMGALMDKETVREKFHEKIRRDAALMIRSIERQTHRYPSFMSLAIFKIQQGYWQTHVDDSIDYQYWKEQGWIDPNTTFYYPIRKSRWVVALARLIGSIIAKFVT